jgi:hypothetical protein
VALEPPEPTTPLERFLGEWCRSATWMMYNVVKVSSNGSPESAVTLNDTL